jgi:uncharacterized membrane protein YccF (DUF307 family)
MMKKINKEKIATLCLMTSMFFLPFGYDALFVTIMKLTGSFWKADLIFYFISGFFLGLYFLFSGKNPFSHIINITLSTWNDKIKHYFKK